MTRKFYKKQNSLKSCLTEFVVKQNYSAVDRPDWM
jgi:hypothetical protein